nr:hypothetical protein [Clavibacter capsici]
MGQDLTLVVLDHLLHDAVGSGLVRVDDVDRNRGHARLTRSEETTLPGVQEHVSTLIKSREYRRDDAAGLNALDGLDRQHRDASHVRLDDEGVRVDVFDDPAGDGGLLDDAHGSPLPFNRLFSWPAKESMESGNAGVHEKSREIRELATAHDLLGTQARNELR